MPCHANYPVCLDGATLKLTAGHCIWHVLDENYPVCLDGATLKHFRYAIHIGGSRQITLSV